MDRSVLVPRKTVMGKNSFSIRNYMAVTAVLMVLIMTVLDVTVVNVALPVLAVEFGVSDSYTVWIVTVYQLVVTMLLLPLSSVGDLYSYRKTFLVGVVIFTCASALCAASQSFAAIIASRALQGIGAACVMSVNIALVRLIYPREVLGRGLALNAMVIAIATAAGPTIAGAILTMSSWHWLFMINVPFGIAAFVLGKRLLPSNPAKDKNARFDWRGGMQNAVAFGLVFYSLGSFARKGDALLNFVLLVAGGVVGVFYVRRQLGRTNPMLPVDLFGIRLYSLSIMTSVCSFIAQNVAMIALPFMFLNNLGFSEITAGLLMTPWPLATMIISPLAARFVEKHNPGATAATGMAVYAAGVVLLLVLPGTGASAWQIAWRMAMCGVGFGIFQTPNNIVMVIATPVSRTGGAGGMQSTARLVGQTLGATIVTVIFAMLPDTVVSVRSCLAVALAMAVTAGFLSLSRAGRISSSGVGR